jgi:hypothetical protein
VDIRQITAVLDRCLHELSNQALLPLQNAKKRIETLQGIGEIHQEITDVATLEEDAYELINKYIEEQRALRVIKAKEDAEKAATQARELTAEAGGLDDANYKPPVIQFNHMAETSPKKIVSVDTSSVRREVNSSGIIETEQDIDNYLAALKSKLFA